jgi:hypothetical protein
MNQVSCTVYETMFKDYITFFGQVNISVIAATYYSLTTHYIAISRDVGSL